MLLLTSLMLSFLFAAFAETVTQKARSLFKGPSPPRVLASVRTLYFCYEVCGGLWMVQLPGAAVLLFLWSKYTFSSSLVGIITAGTVDISTRKGCSPDGGEHKAGMWETYLSPPRLENPWGWEELLVIFPLYCRAPGIPCILPWKDSLLLPRNSGLGRSCLFIHGLKCTFGEEKWTYLFNYNSVCISVCCFFNWKFCLETDPSFKKRKLEHCFLST